MSRGEHARTFFETHRLDVWAGVIVLGSLAVRAWALHQTWFWQDDFVIAADSRSRGLAPDYLLQDYNGHLMPAKFMVVWAAERLAPLSWGVAAATILLLTLLAGIAFWALLKTMFGQRTILLLPLAVTLLCPIGVVSFTWWASALESLPLQIALSLTVLAHVRWLRGDGPRWGWLALGSLVFGLLWIEKALVILVVLAWVELVYRNRSAVAMRSRLAMWGRYLLVAVGYLLLYTSRVERPTDPVPDPARILTFVQESLLSVLPVGLLGGPWQQPHDASTLLPVVSQPWLLLVWVVLGLLVYASFRVSGNRALLGWLLVGGYVALAAGLVAATRLDFMGPIIGRDPRYLTDAVPVVVLGVTAAFLPVRDAEPPVAENAPGPVLRRPHLVVASLILAYLCSAWITTYYVAAERGATGAREWVQAARGQLAALPDAAVFDAPVPEFVVASFFGKFARTSSVLGGVVPASRFDQPTLDLLLIDGEGKLQPSTLIPEMTTGPGPEPGCGWAVGGRPTMIWLPGALPASDWVVRIGYYAAMPTQPRIDVGTERWTVPLAAGVHELSLFPQGPVSWVRWSGLDAEEAVCVTSVSVGRPWFRSPDAPMPSEGREAP